MDKKTTNNGFTLIESIFSITLIVILATIVTPIYQVLNAKNNLDVTVGVVSQTLRRAQFLSVAISNDSNWGVFLATSTVILFNGNNYSSRNVNFDEIFNISPTVEISGVKEVVFSKFDGTPQSHGVISFALLGETKNITINSKERLFPCSQWTLYC
ncbi:MAG: type II secretion system protein [Patescibacteria group bacterium]|nr:type II secretion system protein [Patescibacteria group bacterium]